MATALVFGVQRADFPWYVRERPALSMTRRSAREESFEAFFLDQYDIIARSVAFVCGDRDRAADATQEAFIRAYARWSKVRRYENPSAWVRRIAINISRDTHRSETRRRRREERVAGPTHVPSSVDEPGAGVLDLLEGLPDRQRAIAALFYLDDLPVAEISAALDIAEGTVRFHLNQARAALRQQLDERSTDHAR